MNLNDTTCIKALKLNAANSENTYTHMYTSQTYAIICDSQRHQKDPETECCKFEKHIHICIRYKHMQLYVTLNDTKKALETECRKFEKYICKPT